MNKKMIIAELLFLKSRCQELCEDVINYKTLPKSAFNELSARIDSIISDIRKYTKD